MGAAALAAGLAGFLVFPSSQILPVASLVLLAMALLDTFFRRRGTLPAAKTPERRDAPPMARSVESPAEAGSRHEGALDSSPPVPGPLQGSEEDELERRLRGAIQDAGARHRLLEAKRARHPDKPQALLIQLVLEDYERDRR
jgi:hypothetical protein